MRCAMKAFPMVLMLALTGCMIAGGRCDYVDIEGVAEVVSTPQAKQAEEGIYRFRFSPTHPDTERTVPGARMAGEKLRGRVFVVFDEENRAALEGASVGDRFHVLAHVETRGTCTPLSFRIAAPIVPEQGEIRFGRDSLQLSGEARRELDRYVRAYQYMRQRGASPRFRLDGHTDGRGPREYNLIRGQRMAEAVRDYLVAEGVRQEDVVVRSYGEEHPRCTTSEEEACQAQNRRVEVHFEHRPVDPDRWSQHGMRSVGAPLICKAHEGYESGSRMPDAGPARGGLCGQKMQEQ
ncbi:MAG: OmpA family protein [Gammaproteobacteria bacterium]|nr:MAG: OmpA family protein [Gammaproteobacteria bacterium]